MRLLRRLRGFLLAARGRVAEPDFDADHERNIRILTAIADEWEHQEDGLALLEARMLRTAARGYAALWVEKRGSDATDD